MCMYIIFPDTGSFKIHINFVPIIALEKYIRKQNNIPSYTKTDFTEIVFKNFKRCS